MKESTAQVEAMLGKVDLFTEMSSRHLRALARMGREVDHHAGHKVAVEGQGAMAFHLILSGTASVSIHGREVRTLGPGDYFGEISMIDGRPRSSTVVAVEPLRTLAIKQVDFLHLLEDEPSVSLQIMRQLCSRLRAKDEAGVGPAAGVPA